jgi:hypothetical protein
MIDVIKGMVHLCTIAGGGDNVMIWSCIVGAITVVIESKT